MTTTAVTNPNLPQPPFGNENKTDQPKIQTCEVGPFRLKGVKVDLNQYNEDQIKEMIDWAKENGAYVAEDKGLFSWKNESKRDWFLLRWS
jgi:hypothetical protein